MEIFVLGSGTSTGVPIVGCHCGVCESKNPKNKRLRSSVAVRVDHGETILIDTSPDLRQQALTNGIEQINAVFYTHCHADHTHGIDELRTYNYLQKSPIDIFGAGEHIAHLRRQFAYIFEEGIQRGGGKPELTMHAVDLMRPFTRFDETITPIKLNHGKLLSVGWRIGNFAYCSDVSHIEEKSFEALKGLDVLFLGALRWRRHTTHFTIDEAVKVIERIAPKQAFLTHMGHEVDYEMAANHLPEGVRPAYDQLKIVL